MTNEDVTIILVIPGTTYEENKQLFKEFRNSQEDLLCTFTSPDKVVWVNGLSDVITAEYYHDDNDILIESRITWRGKVLTQFFKKFVKIFVKEADRNE